VQFVILLAAILVLLGVIRSAFFFQVVVAGPSMEPTLHDRYIIFLDRQRSPQRQDVVVVRDPQRSHVFWVKRLIAFEGETVVFVRDQDESGWFYHIYIYRGDTRILLLHEPYLDEPTRHVRHHGHQPERYYFLIGSGEIFVLGDHRDISYDSRASLPIVKNRDFFGRVWIVAEKNSFFWRLLSGFGGQEAGT